MASKTGPATGVKQALRRRVLPAVCSAAAWLLIWEALSLFVNKELLVPAPPAVLSRLLQLVLTAGFWRITLISLLRITAGYAAGIAAGVIMAVLTARSRLAAWFFGPAQTVIKATPIASFIILALVWIQSGRIPTFITFLMVLPIVWSNISKGIAQTDPKLLEMARVYRFSRIRIVRDIYFYSVMPYFAAAATTSMGLAWKAGIAAEVLSIPKDAIGTAIYDSKIYLETVDLFAWSLVVILISLILEKVIRALLGRYEKSAGRAVTEEKA